ncbi:N-acetyltransferase [Bacillus sp. HMF5848]|nr:N-acetyltransferase [Bacillus sp. HMF5848]
MPIPGDGRAVYDAITASLSELKPWMPFAQNEQSMEDVEKNIREAHIDFIKREDLRLLIFLKDTNQLVASSGLHRIDWDVRRFEIGYWIDSRFSGHGYITEAVKGIENFAITELNARRLEIRCEPENVKSRAVAERLGYSLEGILRKDALSADSEELRDTCVYGKVVDKETKGIAHA